MQRIYLLCLCVVLAGCTAAQRQAANIKSVTEQAITEGKSCVTNVYNNPDYEPVVVHLPSPENIVQPPMAILTDDARPTKEESQLLVKLHDDLIPCRQSLLQKTQSVVPDIAQIMSDDWFESDQITMQLVKRKITWGEAAKQKQQLAINGQKKINDAVHQLDASLAASHQAELAQRQAASNAFANSMQQWGQQVQNNRPRMTNTNCSSFTPNTINCNSTSY